MLVDMHAHVIPGELPPVGSRAAGASWPRMLPVADGARVFATNAEGRGYTAQPVWWDPAERRRNMQAKGVDAEVLSPFPGLLGYGYSAADARDLARYVNDWIANVCQANPGTFFGLGMAPMQDLDMATAELAGLKQRGLLGVEIASNINGASLGEDQFLPFFKEAEAQGLAVFVHGLGPTFSDRFPRSAGAGFGVAAEVALAAVSLAESGIFNQDRCPNLRIAISHGAGGYPLMLTRQAFFWGGTWNEEPPTTERVRELTTPSPIETARKFYYDSLVFDRRALRYLADMLGTDHLLIGTDHPAMLREQPVAKSLREIGLSQAEIDDVTWHNCFRWLDIAEPAAS